MVILISGVDIEAFSLDDSRNLSTFYYFQNYFDQDISDVKPIGDDDDELLALGKNGKVYSLTYK